MVLINKSAVYDETKGAVNSFLLGIARNQVLRRLRQERRPYRLTSIMKK